MSDVVSKSEDKYISREMGKKPIPMEKYRPKNFDECHPIICKGVQFPIMENLPAKEALKFADYWLCMHSFTDQNGMMHKKTGFPSFFGNPELNNQDLKDLKVFSGYIPMTKEMVVELSEYYKKVSTNSSMSSQTFYNTYIENCSNRVSKAIYGDLHDY